MLTPFQVLTAVFQHKQFRQGQEAIIVQIVAGQDALIIMPTGGGKSLCYQIPALCRQGLTVVVSPLLALMQDQVEHLTARGVAAATLNSSLNSVQCEAVYQAIETEQLKLLYVSPERLQHPALLQRLQRSHLGLFAIDEAHCISQWGPEFRPEYRHLGQLKQRFPTVPLIALTATADEATREDILLQLGLTSPLVHVASFNRPQIHYQVWHKTDQFIALTQYLAEHNNAQGIIYTLSRRNTETLALQLRQAGFNASPYHAGLSSPMRMQVQRDFIQDKIRLMVATVAFGMGIDKPNVRFVIHYDLPLNIESYYQETGRGGRDGAAADAILCYDPLDVPRVARLLTMEDPASRRLAYYKLSAMAALAEGKTCRQQAILSYFGEYGSAPCGQCDNCLRPPPQYDATLEVRYMLSCVARLKQQHPLNTVIDVLRGKQSQAFRDAGYHQLSTYGLGKHHGHAYWVDIGQQLIHRGLLRPQLQQGGILFIAPEARSVLQGSTTLWLAKPPDRP